MTEPTKRELETVRAYLDAGSVVGAAKRMGIREQSVKNRLYLMRRMMGVATNAQLIFALHDKLYAKLPRAKRKVA